MGRNKRLKKKNRQRVKSFLNRKVKKRSSRRTEGTLYPSPLAKGERFYKMVHESSE